jgi:hypothetical protein
MATLIIRAGKVAIQSVNQTIGLKKIERKGKVTEYTKFEVKNAQAIAPVYVANPEKSYTLNLRKVGESANAHIFEADKPAKSLLKMGLIVNKIYIAKRGHKINVH